MFAFAPVSVGAHIRGGGASEVLLSPRGFQNSSSVGNRVIPQDFKLCSVFLYILIIIKIECDYYIIIIILIKNIIIIIYFSLFLIIIFRYFLKVVHGHPILIPI